MRLGLKKGIVEVVPYDPCWEGAYLDERNFLLEMLPKSVGPFEHIGSTSVPGLAAKPKIDFIAGVYSIEEAFRLKEDVVRCGYEHRPNGDLIDRVFFVKGPEENRTHNFSLVVRDGVQWKNQLLFRDYLRKNLKARQEYQLLKIEFSKKFPADLKSYAAAKDMLIKEILEKARREEEQ